MSQLPILFSEKLNVSSLPLRRGRLIVPIPDDGPGSSLDQGFWVELPGSAHDFTSLTGTNTA